MPIRFPTDEEWPAFFSLAIHYQRLWLNGILTQEEAVSMVALRWVEKIARQQAEERNVAG